MCLYLAVAKVNASQYIAAAVENKPKGYRRIWFLRPLGSHATLHMALVVAVQDILQLFVNNRSATCTLVISDRVVYKWLTGGVVRRNKYYIDILEDIDALCSCLHSFSVECLSLNIAQGFTTLDYLREYHDEQLITVTFEPSISDTTGEG